MQSDGVTLFVEGSPVDQELELSSIGLSRLFELFWHSYSSPFTLSTKDAIETKECLAWMNFCMLPQVT